MITIPEGIIRARKKGVDGMPDESSIAAVVTTPNLTYRQRVHQLALLAEEALPYPKLSV